MSAYLSELAQGHTSFHRIPFLRKVISGFILVWWGIVGGVMEGSVQVGMSPEQEPVVAAVRKTLPSVVNIHTERVKRHYFTTPYQAFLGRYFVQEQPVYHLGSGLLVSQEGHIITNHHVVDLAHRLRIRVTLHDGSTYEAIFLHSDISKDLALIQIPTEKPVAFFDLNQLSPNYLGQTVIALGNPVGYQSSVSRGILSQKNRTFATPHGKMDGLLQTDAAINPGNSGGPLVDIQGKLVGLNTAKFAGEAIEGIGFAIPGKMVAEWVQEVMEWNQGERQASPLLSLVEGIQNQFGMTLQDLTPSLAKTFGYHTVGGLVIVEVEPGGAADRAGLRRGMLVVGIDGVPVLNEGNLPLSMGQLSQGEEVEWSVVEVIQQGNSIFQRGGRVRLKAGEVH